MLAFVDYKCSNNRRKCKDKKQCVAWYKICDGIETCKDGSDEHPDFCKGKCSLVQHM